MKLKTIQKILYDGIELTGAGDLFKYKRRRRLQNFVTGVVHGALFLTNCYLRDTN